MRDPESQKKKGFGNSSGEELKENNEK